VNRQLEPGRDYYVEHGLLVFTAAYHRARGSCCRSGCRHCPYWPPHGGGTELAPDGLDADARRRQQEDSEWHVSEDSAS
jgi:hypothetical protein